MLGFRHDCSQLCSTRPQWPRVEPSISAGLSHPCELAGKDQSWLGCLTSQEAIPSLKSLSSHSAALGARTITMNPP